MINQIFWIYMNYRFLWTTYLSYDLGSWFLLSCTPNFNKPTYPKVHYEKFILHLPQISKIENNNPSFLLLKVTLINVGGCDFIKGHDTIHIPNLGSIAPHPLANYWYDHSKDLPLSCACNLTHTSLKTRTKLKFIITHFSFSFFHFLCLAFCACVYIGFLWPSYFLCCNLAHSLKKQKQSDIHSSIALCVFMCSCIGDTLYISTQGWDPSTKNTRHVETNVNTQKENQDHQNNSNEVEDIILKGYPLPQISVMEMH